MLAVGQMEKFRMTGSGIAHPVAVIAYCTSSPRQLVDWKAHWKEELGYCTMWYMVPCSLFHMSSEMVAKIQLLRPTSGSS